MEAVRRERFERLWRQHQSRLRRLVARLTGDADLADDLTQEVSLKAFAAFGGFRGEAAALTWLSRIAINVVHRHRETRRPPPLSLDATRELFAGDASDPHRLAVQAGLRPIVWTALDTLPEELRTALILQVYEGLKYREIAALLGVPLGTVKSRLHNGLVRLREELKDHDL